MDLLLVALGIGLPLLKFVLFPARAMARGGHWRLVGAVLIVGLMMGLWAGVRSLGDVATAFTSPGTAVAAAPDKALTLPDLENLAHLF